MNNMDFINKKLSKEEVKLIQPLVLAYIGDSVYELYIRLFLMEKLRKKPHELHVMAIKYVSAKAQADILYKITKELTDEEKDIVRRGRNAKNHHVPKNTDVRVYMYSTAFETLIGFLYMSGKKDRLKNILELCTKLTII